MCTLVQPLQLFNSSFSRAFQVEATANKRLKVQVKYASFLSPLSGPLSSSLRLRCEWRQGVSCRVKEERITQDTLQIKKCQFDNLRRSIMRRGPALGPVSLLEDEK